jgi:hypothetical protein
LQHYIVASNRTGALLWKAVAHVLGDLSFAATLVLAPFGLVLARGREASAASALWILLNVTLVALGGFAGARMRAPFEPHLILFASIVLAGSFAKVRRRWVAVAGLVAVLSAAILVPQIPRTLKAWPDYGVRWQERPKGWRTLVRGEAGFNFLVRSGTVSMVLRSRGEADDAEGAMTRVEVRLDGKSMGRELLETGERRELSYPWPDGRLAFVELEASGATAGDPRALLVVARPH